MSKDYVSLNRLTTFLDELKKLFATKKDVSETNDVLSNRIEDLEKSTSSTALTVVQEAEGATIIATDKNGTTEAFLSNGKSGVHVGSEAPEDNSNVWINPTGEAVEITGKSAYEIALAHGFEGSEEEWLESLVGKDYVLTETDKQDIASIVSDDGIPSYWESHIAEKAATIKALQDEGGKDAFSFVVMTDMHYPSNLGKKSPILAKRILDECDIRFALCLGDTQTRGCHSAKELLLAENEAIEKMLSPIRDRLLQTEGNHDGSYGILDRDGDGNISNTNAEGNIKAPAERETYVSNLTPAELHSAIYRKVGLVGNVHFDESGSGYYVDDTASKVRYIILNTHCNDYELQEDGTSKYPKMWVFRFTQSQFDLVIKALSGIPSDSWNVVVAGHCPLFQEIGDREVMQGVLNAYKNKTTYSGTYAGTASGKAYTNLAEPQPDNTTDTSKWVNGYRFGNSGITAENSGSPSTLSNSIECKDGDVIRIKGVTLRTNDDRFQIIGVDQYGTSTTGRGYYNAPYTIGGNPMWECSVDDDGVYTVTILPTAISAQSFRFAMPTPEDASKVIVTVNEEIIEGDVSGYDAVSVDCDFTSAKGGLVGYFAGHIHKDHLHSSYGFNIITTRCDAHEENTDGNAETTEDDVLYNERVAGTITEQSFDVFTVNKATHTIHATKIGAGANREINY